MLKEVRTSGVRPEADIQEMLILDFANYLESTQPGRLAIVHIPLAEVCQPIDLYQHAFHAIEVIPKIHPAI